MRIFSIYYILLSFSLFIACKSDEEATITPTSETTFGIRHDVSLSKYEKIAENTTSSTYPDFSPVVVFDYSLNGSQNYEYTATGVLINKDWILTAAHNFYDMQEQKSVAPKSGIQVKVGNNPNQPEATYKVSRVVLHPTWLAGNQNLSDGNDICLIKVANSIKNINPASLYKTNDETIDAPVWHCGFGDYSKIAGQNRDLFSKKHAIHNILDRVVGGLTTSTGGKSYKGGLLAFDFDNPAGTINALGDNEINEDESLLGSGKSSPKALDYEGSTVTGDSGGPLFINKNGQWQVIGVLSGGASEPIKNHKDGNYGDISIYTRVSSSIDWIESVIQ